MAVFRLSVALATMCLLTGNYAFALGDWTKDPAEQDRRLQHLPGDLPLAIKSLRALGYSTKVSSWDEKKQKLTADGDAGRSRWDGYRYFYNLDDYTLKYRGLTEDKKLVSVPEEEKRRAIDNLPPVLGQSLERLIAKEGFLATKVRLPSCVDDSTSIRLERLGQSIDVCRSKYNYSVPRSHACDWWD